MNNLNRVQIPLNILAQVVGSSASQGGMPMQVHFLNAVPASLDPNLGNYDQRIIGTTTMAGLEAALNQHFLGTINSGIGTDLGQHFVLSSGTPTIVDLSGQLSQQIISVAEVKDDNQTVHTDSVVDNSGPSTIAHQSMSDTVTNIYTDVGQSLVENSLPEGDDEAVSDGGGRIDLHQGIFAVKNSVQVDEQHAVSIEHSFVNQENASRYLSAEQEQLLSQILSAKSSVPVEESDDSKNKFVSFDNVEQNIDDNVVDDYKNDDDDYEKIGDITALNIMEETNEDDKGDYRSKLSHISDKISLLKKELGTIRRKKSKLLKEVEKMTQLEEQLQQKLDTETDKHNKLKNLPKSSVTTSTVASDVKRPASIGMVTRSGRIKGEAVDVAKDFFPDSSLNMEDDNVSMMSEIADVTTVKTEVTETELLVQLKTEPETTAETSVPEQRKKRSRRRFGSEAITKRVRSGKQEHKCTKCGKEFKQAQKLTKHLEICVDLTDGEQVFAHLPVLHLQNFVCEQCNKRFTTKYALILHQRMHAGDFRNLCNVCGKGFVNITALKRHMDYHVRRFKCDVCGKYFSRLRELNMHKRRHTGERPYMCPYCGKSYPTASHLRYHMPFHNEVKAHVCPICQKGFHHSKAFRNHYLQHSGEKPFTCILCPERFSSRYRLLKHQTVDHNSDSTKISCETCGKVFLTIGNLKSHQRSHSTDRPHKCDRCDKQYKNIYDLIIHKKKKHETSASNYQQQAF